MKKLIFLLILTLIQCERLADAFFSDKDDVKMGFSLDKEIRANKKEFKILENEQLQSYVQSIVNQILKSPKIKRKKIYQYKVTLIEDDKTINAFCTPGGFIYVYTGLLKFLENEATLAAIMAHEIAHAEKRHARQRMISALGIQIVISILLGTDSSIFKEILVNLGGNLALLSNSRKDELEADEYGFQYLKSTPYYQGAMSYFFDKMSKDKQSRVSKALEKLLSTHPIPEERLKANENRIQKNKIAKATPSNLFTNRYKTKMKEYFSTYDSEQFEYEVE